MNGDTRRAGRKPRYQVFLGVWVSPTMKAQINALAEERDVDLSEVVRQALKVGLSGLTEPEAPEQADDAARRRWWDGLDWRQRSR